MLKRLQLVLTAFLVLITGVSAQNVIRVPFQELPSFVGWVEDELVVALEPAALDGFVLATDGRGLPRVNRAGLQAVIDRQGVLGMRRQFPGAQRQAVGANQPDLSVYYKVQLRPGADLEATLLALEADGTVEHVERIGIHTLHQVPNDPYYEGSPSANFPYDQWHLWANNSIDAELAWDQQTGDPNVVVGILDSGTRYFHIDIGGNSAQWGPGNPFSGGNAFVNPNEIPGNGNDDDGNGYTDDTIGWDFVASAGGAGVSCIDGDCSGADNDPDDFNGHGTHVAGTVGAITNNGVQVSGVAGGFGDGTAAGGGNGAKVLPCRIGYHARYKGQTTGLVRMDYAAEAMSYLAGLVDRGVNVTAINCSWGSSNSGGLGAAVDLLQSRDVLIVKSAGNSNSSSVDFLSSRPGVLNVAATDQAGNGASFTNYGSWVDVAAPGVDIVSTFRNPDDADPAAHYISVLDGTSMSSPHVAGIAALLESCTPSLSATDKFNLIVGNTTPYSDSRNLGSGIANAKLALDAAGCSGTPCDVLADFSATPTSGCASLLVSFTDNSAGAGINAWAWDFGDGNTSSAQHPSHTYASAGTYNVSLTATSSLCSNSTTQSGLISVSATPVADFSGTPTTGGTPLGVSFTDLSSGGPTAWAWDFGDGNTSTLSDPSHTYLSVGIYTVSLTASNACGGDSVTLVDYITVTEPPLAVTMAVDSVVVTRQNLGGGNKQGIATVTVLDNTGAPVSGATVTGDFSGKTSDPGLSAVTNASGQAVFFSSSAKGGGSWCFDVTNVTGTSLTYTGGNLNGCE